MAASTIDCNSNSMQIAELAGQLAQYATRILDPSCQPVERQQCQKLFEEFKETSPYCVDCALLLVKQTDPFTKHLGIQLLEYFIKCRWGSLSGNEQLEFRQHLLMLIKELGSAGSYSPPPSYVKESLAKLIVELIKRSWPQLWPNMQEDLHSVGQEVLHFELLLLIYRRLVEDLLSYDATLTNRRKADMLSELQRSNLLPLVKSIIQAMQSGHEQLQTVAITTLSALAEWIDLSYVTADNCICLVLLYNFIASDNLRSIACECLSGILCRKGDLKQTRDNRQHFLKLFSKEAMEVIQAAAMKASHDEEEDSYQFLKKACHVLVQLGAAQLVPLWDSSEFQAPDNFSGYLTLLLQFTQHPSQVLCEITFDLWSSFIAHNYISKNPVFLAFLSNLLSVLRSKQLKVGDPTSNNHQSCHYSRIDFDGQIEHSVFFSKFKGLLNRLLVVVSELVPKTACEEVLTTAQKLVQEPVTGPLDGCSLLHLEWDTFVSYLDCWTCSVGSDRTCEEFKQATPAGVTVLQTLLDYQPPEPLTAAAHLRALQSGLIMFVSLQEELLKQYLEKILTFAAYPGLKPQNKYLQLSRDQRQVRLTALYCLNSIVKNNATAVLPTTPQLLNHYQHLVQENLLLYIEKCYFIEVFVLLSHFRSPEEQLQLLKELLAEVHGLCDADMISAAGSVEQFVQYIGLHLEPSNSAYPLCSLHRSQILYCIHATMGVLQKLSPRERAQCGAPPLTVSHQHPSSQYLLPLLNQLLLPMIRTFHQLWSDQSGPYLSEHFKGIVSVSETEKKAIVGVAHHSGAEESDELTKIHHQLITGYDQCVLAVGFAWVVYGPQSLVEGVLHNVFSHLNDTLPLRIKPIIRNMITPMVVSCPPDLWITCLCPVLTHICSISFTRLQQNWGHIIQRLSLEQNDDESQTLSQEVLLQQFTVDLTRQFCMLLEAVCIKKDSTASRRKQTKAVKEEEGSLAMMDDEMDDLSTSSTPHQSAEGGGGGISLITDLAVCLLDDANLNQLLVFSVFVLLTWRDSFSVRRSAVVAAALLQKLPFDDKLFKQLLEQVLLIHGADEGTQIVLVTLAFQLYEITVKHSPDVASLIANLPGCSQKKVQNFNNGVLSGKKKPGHVKPSRVGKWKKDEFKKLLTGIIGKPLGQMFKNKAPSFDLPKLVIKKKQQRPEGVIDNIALLFNDNVV